jgi:tetratricopeptide (TPR) repeat protein
MLIDEGAIQQEAGQWYVTPDVDISSLGVPNTLQELILTRFDRLDSTQKAVIQVASVIGKDFSLPVLYGVLDDMEQDVIRNTVNTLTERDFVLPQFSSLDNKYTFRHILMSDAIYSTILRKERQRLHGCVGDVIEKLFGERLEDQVEVLANHYRWSNKPDSALSYLIVAGQKAERQYLNEQAFRQYSAALEVIPRIDPNPDQICQVHKGMGDALAFKGDYLLAQEHFQLAIESIEELDYQSRVNTRSGLYRRIAKASERQGDYDRALSQLALAQDALDTSNDTHQIEQAKVLNDIGWIHFRRGNFSTAGDLFIQALELVKKAADYHVMASIYNRLGGVFYYLGDWDQAASYLRKSIQIRERIGDVIGLASSSNNLGNLEIEMGLFDDALEDLQRNLALVERLGQVEGVAVAHNNLGWLYTLRGELELAEGALIKALKTAIQIGYSSLIREASKNIGELYLAKGDYVQARQALVEVAPVFEELGANDQLLHVYRLLGEVALGRKEPNKASEWDQKLTEVIDRYHEKSKEPPTLHWGEVLRFRGMLAIANQDWNYAEGYLQESIKVFESLHSQLYLGRSLYQMGRLAAARENFQTAYAHYHKAGGIFQHIGAKVDIRRADNALEELSTPK